jgi:hypothetical protein
MNKVMPFFVFFVMFLTFSISLITFVICWIKRSNNRELNILFKKTGTGVLTNLLLRIESDIY